MTSWVDPAEIVAWLRGRTGAHGGAFTSADDVADAIDREFGASDSVSPPANPPQTDAPKDADHG